jgi:hypothetical protein
MGSDGIWEEGRVWSTNTSTILLNLTNSSGVAWNLIGVDKDTTLLGINQGMANHSSADYNYTTMYLVANFTSPNSVTRNITLQLPRNHLVLVEVYNHSPVALIPPADYVMDFDTGIFELGTNSTGVNSSGNNLTFSYNFFDVTPVKYQSYPNHTQTYVPYRSNWTFNKATSLFNGDANWMWLNSSIQETMVLNRALWGT